MDQRLKEQVGHLVSATLKGSLYTPDPPTDMLNSLQIAELEKALSRAPLTRRELLEAADEYAAQLEAALELVPS